MQSDLKQLRKTKVCYLGNLAPSKRIGYALELASEFFDRENFVQGFGDLYISANKSDRKKILNKYNELELNFDLSFKQNRNYTPDLIWIDGVATIPEKYKTIPTIYSSCRPNGKGISILVDSREQKPLFYGDTFEKQMLVVGDYTTDKLLNKFHIERKSPQDLYSTITKGHARFRNELIRADVYGVKLVMYVECSKKDFVDKKFPGGSMRNISGDTLEKIINTIEQRYKMEVVWSNNRNITKAKILKRLKLEEKMSGGKTKSVSKNHKLKPVPKRTR